MESDAIIAFLENKLEKCNTQNIFHRVLLEGTMDESMDGWMDG